MSLSEYQTFVSAISQIPVARWWLEEVLIRGTPAGGIAGAHVVIGAELIDPLGGVTRTIKGPYPLDALQVLSGQAAADWNAVLGVTLGQQQATLAARDATIADLDAQLAAMTVSLAERDKAIADQTEALADRDAEIVALNESLTQARKPAEAQS